MKYTTNKWMFVVSLLALAWVCEAIENPNVSTLPRNNTVPSQGQSRRKISQPVTSSGNNVITGNVGGGRHFRGVVPYGSTYYSGGNLTDTGSTSVNQFIRRSVNPVISDRNPTQSRPYYQANRTTSSFRQQTGISTSASTANILTGRSRYSTYEIPALPSTVTQITPGQIQRPLSTSNNLELETILARQSDLNEAAQQSQREERTAKTTSRLTDQNQKEFENFFDNLPQEPEITNAEQAKIDQAESLRPLKPGQNLQQEKPKDNEALMDEQESIRISLEDQQDQDQDQEQEQELGQQPDRLQIGEKTAKEDDAAEQDVPDSLEDRLMKRAESAWIRGKHKTFKSLADAKFSTYMGTAQTCVVNGQYYKAADAYDLAMVWIPNDPRPYAGKAFALFAAGEYMSSAYNLSRVLELNPSLAARPVDIAALLNDRDVYENRILEISTWQQRSNSGELAFLLAYLYHHDGKSAKAENAVNQALAIMPDSVAVSVLKTIIDDTASQR